MGDCSKSRKVKDKKSSEKPKFECAKCGLGADDKKHICKPVKPDSRDKSKAKAKDKGKDKDKKKAKK